jgi:hypothetical protein
MNDTLRLVIFSKRIGVMQRMNIKKTLVCVLFLSFFIQTSGPGMALPNPNGMVRPDSFVNELGILPDLSGIDPFKDAQSTTGPLPPVGVNAKGALFASPKAVTIGEVPAYIWHDGCGPTAVGMIFGYWDIHGYDWLIPGDASAQTDQVNEAISSSLGAANHYSDYALPIDYSPSPLAMDKSELPVGDEHNDDSIADFMRTSQSHFQNYYGWSWFSDVRRSFLGYFDLVNPLGTVMVSTNLYFSGLWDAFKAEIDAGRPVVFLVDTDGNGVTDHFITAIGYDEVAGLKKYAALNTWDTMTHWYTFNALGAGNPWGIYGAITFRIDHLAKTVYMPELLR